MIAITPNTAVLNQNGQITFVASGGTAPYVFSLVSGGGSIDSSTGLYTAPPETGSALVQVVDSLAAIAQANITINSPLTLVCDIIRTGMGLASDQCYLWDQKILIPPDSRLYVSVGILSQKFYGNSREYDSSGAGLNEKQFMNAQATLSLDIFSRGVDARDRKEEVLMALKSTYSQYQQEANSFAIAGIPKSFANLSTIEGSAIPYRFNASVNIHYFITKVTPVLYYDTFPNNQVVINK